MCETLNWQHAAAQAASYTFTWCASDHKDSFDPVILQTHLHPSSWEKLKSFGRQKTTALPVTLHTMQMKGHLERSECARTRNGCQRAIYLISLFYKENGSGLVTTMFQMVF